MPFIRCVYSGDKNSLNDIMKSLSSTGAELLQKPEAVMCVQVEHTENLMFGGSTEPCAIINVESIGGNFESVLTPFTDILDSVGGVAQGRVFITFRNVSDKEWGCHGVTIEHLNSKK